MKRKTDALHSSYMIDGVRMQLTPAQILDACLNDMTSDGRCGSEPSGTIVDETIDPSPSANTFQSIRAQEYLERIGALLGKESDCPMEFADQYTKGRIARALIDAIWMKGHFGLGDLMLSAKWKWNPSRLGNMAAFYSSVEAAADFVENLGICLSEYSFTESDRLSNVTFKVEAAERPSEEEDAEDEFLLASPSPFGSGKASISRRRNVPDSLDADPDSWIIFIPFDTCDFRMGCSLLCRACGPNGDQFPEIGDADYFMDCYEVVREMVEDGVIIAGTTVGDGGLLTAVKRMTAGGVGADIDLSDVMKAFGEKDRVRILFGEVPGVVVQIRDLDFDYLDAELLLQDVLYFPLGHPSHGTDSVRVKASAKTGLQTILESLLTSNQLGEGED